MRILMLLSCFVLSGCLAPAVDDSQTRAVISTRDIVMNRPNTDTREALFRLFPDGTGTVEFLANPDGAQDVGWTLTGAEFCIQAAEGLMQYFGCATLRVNDMGVTLAHTQSDSTVTGVFVPR